MQEATIQFPNIQQAYATALVQSNSPTLEKEPKSFTPAPVKIIALDEKESKEEQVLDYAEHITNLNLMVRILNDSIPAGQAGRSAEAFFKARQSLEELGKYLDSVILVK